MDTVREWSDYANITFQAVDSGGDIRITFHASTGNWSLIGRHTLEVGSDKATMNLGASGRYSSRERPNGP